MKKILTLLAISSLVILAGCASDPASVNVNAGTTEAQNQNENTEVVVNANDNTNENTNTVGTALELSENTKNAEVDTSDWETYTNYEYGFSFKYPSEWGNVEIKRYSMDEYREGEKVSLAFFNDGEMRANISYGTPSVSIETLDYKFIGPSDGQDILFEDIDLELSDKKLAENIIRYPGSELAVKRVHVLDQNALRVVEKYNYVDLYIETLHYLIPNYRQHNIRIAGDLQISDDIESLIESLKSI